MAAQDILLQLRLQGQKAVSSGLTGTSKDVTRMGSAADRAGRSMSGMGKRALKAGAGIAGAYASFAGAKNAITTTTDLGKATLSMNKNFGLSIKSGSAWAAVAKTRNVDTKALTQTFGKLSGNIAAASRGADSQATLFKSLGITQKKLQSMSFDETLKAVADGLGELPAGAKRTDASMKLFGRGWQTVAPILRGGSKAMQEQLDLADRYGATLKGKTVKEIEALIKAERESKFAMMGLQVAFGTQLAPAMTKVIGVFSKFVLGVREGTGAGGQFAATAKQVWADLKPVRDTLVAVGRQFAQHPALIAAVVVAFAGFKVMALVIRGITAATTAWTAAQALARRACILTRIQLVALKVQAIAISAATKAWAAGQWLLNAALTANPIGLVVAGVAALAAGLVIAYKKSATFRNAINAAWGVLKSTFGWVKSNWGTIGKILAGPIGVAVRTIRKYFDSIKGAAKGAINGVISVFNAGISAINAVTPGAIKVAGKTVFPGIPDIPQIPGLAAGGTIRRGGMAMVGERGPEAVQLPTGARVFPNGTQAAPGGDLSGLIAALHRQSAAYDRLARRPIIGVVQINGREITRAHFTQLATETAFA